ncbi:MAG: hypothetical protein DSY37_02335 [Hyperthermus sp.]|nr:MAG: hypothetical protein DSY37_02335 [Hyperthermus sp.]
MIAKIRRCVEGGGETLAPRSLLSTLVILTALVYKGRREVVDGVWVRSRCVRSFLNALRVLGHDVDVMSSTRILLGPGGKGESGGGSARVHCGGVVLPFLALIALHSLRVGGRLVLMGESSPEILKAVANLVGVVGGRAWYTTRPFSLIVEGGSGGAYRRIIGLYAPNSILHAALILYYTLALGVEQFEVRHASLLGSEALELLARNMPSLKLEVKPTLTRVSLEEPLDVKTNVSPSPYAALLSALPLLTCQNTSPAILHDIAHTEEEALHVRDLAVSMGFEASTKHGPEGYDLVIEDGSPRGLLHDVVNSGDYALLAIAHVVMSGGVVTGIEVLAEEGLKVESIPGLSSSDAKRGALDASLIGNLEDAMVCKYTLLPTCIAYLGYYLKAGRGAIRGIELIDDRLPGTIESMSELSDSIEVS